MNNYVIQFKHRLIADGRGKDTVRKYCNIVTSFITAINITKKEDITESIMVNYFISLKSKYSVGTINNYNQAISSFLNFIGVRLIMPKQQGRMKRIRKVVTIEDLENVIDPMLDLYFENHVQVRALLYFMYFSGLRLSEVAKLNRHNFNFKTHEVIATIGKQKMERVVFLNDRTERYLQEYFSSYPEITSAFNMSEDIIWRVFDKLNDNKVLPEIHLAPHLFRHSDVTHLLKCGLSIVEVMEIIGHKNIKTTELYQHADKEHLKKRFRELVK